MEIIVYISKNKLAEPMKVYMTMIKIVNYFAMDRYTIHGIYMHDLNGKEAKNVKLSRCVHLNGKISFVKFFVVIMRFMASTSSWLCYRIQWTNAFVNRIGPIFDMNDNLLILYERFVNRPNHDYHMNGFRFSQVWNWWIWPQRQTRQRYNN